MGPLGRVGAWWRHIQDVVYAAAALMEVPVNCTFVVFQYTNDAPDKTFLFDTVLEGEDLHSRLDALLDEHLEDALSRTIFVLTYDEEGTVMEEEIPFQVV